MDEKHRGRLQRMGRGNVQFDCPMDQYTTFRAGGRADVLYSISEPADLCTLLPYLKGSDIPYMVLGKGSNLLVRDEGFRGVMIMLRGKMATLKADPDDPGTIEVGAGMGIGELLNYCIREGLGGLEFLAGIPGSVGGALAMNAGAWGMEIVPLVKTLELVNARGEVMDLEGSRLRASYRSLGIPEGSVIVSSRFTCTRKTREMVSEKVSGYLKERKARQPLEYPSGGSVFKNPPGGHAGRLIDEAGLKGERRGGAMISPKHANFIVNTGGATADDILALMALAREKVEERTGIQLEPEIRLAG
jgi:UDP-N-acetylmuramate dehydrogenase